MTKQKLISFSILITALAILLPVFGTQNLLAQTPTFTEVRKDFPRTEKNLRKWDAPVVADLDQDGYQDLILNDHGLGISICWNNQGKFAKPYDLIMGDLHGVSVGDFDRDGNLELIISRGGGSGSNARNSKMYRVDKERNFTALPDFDMPLALMRGRTVKFIDGDNDGDLDLLNFAFPDKSKKGESENYIYKNDGQGQLVLATTLPPSKSDGQKTLTTDFNGDNILDIILYGHGKVKAYQGKGDLTYKDVSKKIFPNDLKEVTGIIELDYDNDGDFDLFLTRGKEFEIGETFYDADTKNFAKCSFVVSQANYDKLGWIIFRLSSYKNNSIAVLSNDFFRTIAKKYSHPQHIIFNLTYYLGKANFLRHLLHIKKPINKAKNPINQGRTAPRTIA